MARKDPKVGTGKKSLKVQEEDSTLMKIQKTLLGLSMQLLQMLVQQLEKLKILTNLMLGRFKYLLSWSKELKSLVKMNKLRIAKRAKESFGGKEKDD